LPESLQDSETGPAPLRIDRRVARVVGLGLIGLLGLGLSVFALLRSAPEAPREIASDPLLAAGFGVYRERCVSCHGESGRGDGPIAKSLQGPKVGDLTDGTWKHGEKPERVEEVIAKGVANTAMPGWGGTFSPEQLRAVTAYVYHLARRDVPAELRSP
jgi:mono/diheme cytochrome c family protein